MKKKIIIAAAAIILLVCIVIAMHLHFDPIKLIMDMHNRG